MTVHPGRRSRAIELKDRRRERDALDRLIGAVRAGQSQALVVRGDPGVGKTVLLDYLAGRASGAGCRVAHAVGVQSEMELAYAGVHQLCAPMLGRAQRLPVPQHDALQTALGLSAGPPPDRFFVGLAVLSLLSGGAGERPLVCLVDDAQWLDRASAQALGFVARRLDADPVGLVFAARDPGAELAGLPELEVGGLRDHDARALLEAALAGPLDARIRDQIIAETRGNAKRGPQRVVLQCRQPSGAAQHRPAQLVQPGKGQLHLPLHARCARHPAPRIGGLPGQVVQQHGLAHARIATY